MMGYNYTEKCDVQNIYQMLLKLAVMKIFKIFTKHHKVKCFNLQGYCNQMAYLFSKISFRRGKSDIVLVIWWYTRVNF